MRRIKARATSTTTRIFPSFDWRAVRAAPRLVPVPSLRASLGSMRAARRAGASPKKRPAKSEVESENNKSVESTEISFSRGVSGGAMARNRCTPPAARSIPNPPPSSAMRQLSTNPCRNKRPREAPSAARTAISRWRAEPRASKRLARLAQEISRTSVDAPRSTR